MQFMWNLSSRTVSFFGFLFLLSYKTSAAVFYWPENNVHLEYRALGYRKKVVIPFLYPNNEKILQKATEHV